MPAKMHRRAFLVGGQTAFFAVLAAPLSAQRGQVLSPSEAFDALLADTMRIIDVRSREEWQETGVGSGVWPISMHESRFAERLFASKSLSGDRQIGLICATGGRSASLLGALIRAGNSSGYADISEGMLGSGSGPGWIASGLPTVPLDVALQNMPAELA
ncbi:MULTISPECIES: rhodanese-like domain-containing protein [Mameliella]|uniref:rhodanese-like domain-containing protein n=1 Tax=Mameliella TaxID=1434019 RepID=UPI000B52DA3B|nr:MULTISPECIES: rhodanese-like domain-containing protein [Mameliella]OWV40294.1 sulfurtransferase [Mameliella alba]OWV58846.1 sulfurtransferase [Mameliella alba]